MKKVSCYLLLMSILCMLTVLTACHGNDESVPIGIHNVTDPEAQQLLNQGKMTIDPKSGEVKFGLNAEDEWTISDEECSWCHFKIERDANYGFALVVDATENDTEDKRYASFRLLCNGKPVSVTIAQDYIRCIKLEYDNFDNVPADESDVSICFNRLPANVTWKITDGNSMAGHMDWLTVDKAGSSLKNNGFVKLHIDKNTGLGRKAAITFSADDAEDVTVTILQSGTLHSNQYINVEHPGTLSTFLGDNAYEWAKIDTLRLGGMLDDRDMKVLRMLLHPMVSYERVSSDRAYYITVTEQVALNVKHLDMSDCEITSGGGNYDGHAIHWMDENDYKGEINTLGKNAFNITRCPLQSIILPKALHEIGSYAFHLLEGIRSITIPANVRVLDSYALFNCPNLVEIIIPKDSKLEIIGYNALFTGTTLEDVYFPSTVEVVEDADHCVLGHVTAKRIHVKWATPPELEKFGVAKKCTLYVPKGTAELYRNAKGWNRAKEIVEE